MKEILKKKKRGWTALLCVFLLLGMIPAAVYGYERNSAVLRSVNSGQAEPFQITMECGWKGMNRDSMEVPATVSVSNQGPEFHGTLKVTISVEAEAGGGVSSRFLEQLLVGVRSASSERNQTYTYELPVEIPQNGTVEKELALELIQYNQTTAVITLEDQTGKTVYETQKDLSSNDMFAPRITIGVLEKEDSCASRIDGMEIEGYQIQAVSILPEDLTVEMPEAETPDMILLLDTSRGSLEESQRQNLERWEAGGGVAVDFQDGVYRELDPTGILGNTMEQVMRAEPEKMVQILLSQDVIDRLPSVQGAYYGLDYGNSWLLEGTPIRKQPGSVLFISLIVGYAVLAGPALYLILKKRKKRYFLWTGICALSLVFVLLIGVLGNSTAMKAPVIVYKNSLYQNGSVVEETLNFEIQAPYNSNVELYLDPSYQMSPANLLSSYPMEKPGTAQEGFEQVRLHYGESKNKIVVSNQPAFALNAFVISRDLPMETEGLTSDLTWMDGVLNGTVSNQTEYLLEDCVLMLPGHMAYIGKLAPGETMELKDLEADSVRDSSQWLVQKLGDNEKTNAFAAQTGIWNINRTSDSLLIGIVTDKEETFQLYSGYETNGNTFYTASASVKCQNESGVRYCPYAQQYYSLDQQAFSYNNYPGSLTMSRQQMEVTYYLNAAYEEDYLRDQCLAVLFRQIFVDPEHLDAMSEDEVNSSLEYIHSLMQDTEELLSYQENQVIGLEFAKPEVLAEEWEAFDGIIEIYNYSTGAYEELEDWKLADSSVKNGIPSPYFLEGNQMKVRYTLDEEAVSSEYYQRMSYQMPDLIVKMRENRDWKRIVEENFPENTEAAAENG